MIVNLHSHPFFGRVPIPDVAKELHALVAVEGSLHLAAVVHDDHQEGGEDDEIHRDGAVLARQ